LSVLPLIPFNALSVISFAALISASLSDSCSIIDPWFAVIEIVSEETILSISISPCVFSIFTCPVIFISFAVIESSAIIFKFPSIVFIF